MLSSPPCGKLFHWEIPALACCRVFGCGTCSVPSTTGGTCPTIHSGFNTSHSLPESSTDLGPTQWSFDKNLYLQEGRYFDNSQALSMFSPAGSGYLTASHTGGQNLQGSLGAVEWFHPGRREEDCCYTDLGRTAPINNYSLRGTPASSRTAGRGN